MKSTIYITVFNLLALTLFPFLNAYPCGPYTAGKPADYRIYRVYEDYGYDEWYRYASASTYYNHWSNRRTDKHRNCKAWQAVTSADIPLEDIHQIVYDTPLNDLQRLVRLVQDPDLSDDLMRNQFAKWIVRHQDLDIAQLLELAKHCEILRQWKVDPWYYPVEGDEVSTELAAIAERAMAYRGERLRDRYLLQAVRALFSISRHEECVNLWRINEAILPDGVIKDMTLPYIAGSLFRIGQTDQALGVYAKIGDINSLLFCSEKLKKNTDEIDHMKFAYRHCPDSPAFPFILQRLCWRIEANFYSDTLQSKIMTQRLYDFATRVADEGKASDRALWYYTASFLADRVGDTRRALTLLQKAEKQPATPFLKGSIHVLRAYLDAKTLPLGSAYDQRLLAHLRWFEQTIKEQPYDYKWIEDHVFDRALYMDNEYYWNDALRKILLSVAAPRHAAAGDPVRALQLTNVADNLLVTLLDTNSRIRKARSRVTADSVSHLWRHYDYQSPTFIMVDTMSVDHLIAYVRQLDQPRTPFDRYLNDRSFTNPDYFNDLIGTKCLRAMRYADAERYLSRVSLPFTYSLNTYPYLSRDPFSLNALFQHVKSGYMTDYKLAFAQEMSDLERTIATTDDPNRKAQAMIRLATGIRNSVNDCWALTHYYRGTVVLIQDYDLDWNTLPDYQRAMHRSEQLLKDALLSFTDDEFLARYYLWNHQPWTVISRYPDTRAAAYVRCQCDGWEDWLSD